jgi:TrmH family RNA methyltransferase
MEIGEVRYARQEPGLVVLENFHAIKHALRFGAHLLGAWTADLAELAELTRTLAPDIAIPAELVDADTLKQASPRGQVVAIARHPLQPDPDTVLAGPGQVILLENPAHLGNLGAVIRVAAAAGAAGVMSTGRQDPWHPDALRGSAGLHFALPVHHVTHPLTGDRELIALDPDGEPLVPATMPPNAVLAFGTERNGLSDALLARADRRVALPMAPNVSSMNLATAVAATLYALKLAA